MHGTVRNGWLIKRGRQVVKFWKLNGYAIPASVLKGVEGVVLYTKYDGVLFQASQVIMRDGIYNEFEKEAQYVLPVTEWKVKKDGQA